MRRSLGLGMTVLMLSALVPGACGRREGAPTLPGGTGPKTVTLEFRLVSAQTGRAVAGARAVIRGGSQPDTGGILAEAISDAEGRVRLEYPNQYAHLEIEAGDRFLKRYAMPEDATEEPSSDVRTLWELNPELGADYKTTFYLNYSNDPNLPDPLCRPPGDIYVFLEASARPYRSHFEEAARRVEAAFGDRRWYFVDALEQVPQGGLPVRVRLEQSEPCPFNLAAHECTWGPWERKEPPYAWVFICPPSHYNLMILMHEFGHVMGVHHLPEDRCGVMSFGKCYHLQDFTPFEKWAFAARKYRRTGNRPPDSALEQAGIYTFPQRGPGLVVPSLEALERRVFVCPVPGR